MEEAEEKEEEKKRGESGHVQVVIEGMLVVVMEGVVEVEGMVVIVRVISRTKETRAVSGGRGVRHSCGGHLNGASHTGGVALHHLDLLSQYPRLAVATTSPQSRGECRAGPRGEAAGARGRQCVGVDCR